MTFILGISAFYHDSAAVLINNEEIIGAVQEERFTRIKHDFSFPENAIKYLLKEANIKLSDINHVVFYEKPFIKFERLLETYVAFSPKGFLSFVKSMPLWIKGKLFQKKELFSKLKYLDNDFNDINKIAFSEHHLSHAASAFFSSPFKEAIILTLDGVGEWATTTISEGKDNRINILKEIHFPHSIGLLYSAFTYFLGFKVNSGEYKVMGLAPYGKPIFKEVILKNLVDLKEDGSFRLNMDYFNYATGLTMTNKLFSKLFNLDRRDPETELKQIHMDLAASIQSVTEEIVLKIVRYISSKYKYKNLCMAGGVALNCTINGKILRENLFENIWIQPASGDAGCALGAAQAFYFHELNKERIIFKDIMKGTYLGPSFKDDEVELELKVYGASFKKLDQKTIITETAKLLSEGKAIGWFQGRMEFGPRALGNRSIIADPRSETMQKDLNMKVKYRESFRPFAPAVLLEDLEHWFDLNIESPYMLFIADVKKSIQINTTEVDKKDLFGLNLLNKKRSIIPAVTHIDYSARIQTVNKKENILFYNLIKEFKKITGVPVLINTSFNIRGEPIVCSVKDAYDCFMGTELDILVVNNFILYKHDQRQKISYDYKSKYKLD